MPRPIYARIHNAALSNNLNVVRSLAPKARIWSVVKANAYGHGIARVYEGLRDTDGFALLDLNEAELLRELGWQGPILLLEGFFCAEDLGIIDRHRLSTVIHNEEQLRLFESARFTRPVDVLLKVNTGMNRLGFAHHAYRAAWQRLRALPQVASIAHMSHFSDADTERGIEHQVHAFEAATAGLPGEASLANSAAILWHPNARRDQVRPGIILYGASPTGIAADINDFKLAPAMSLHSELIAIQDLDAGAVVGYGSGFVAAQKTRIGIVACGYADGYPRHARGWGEQRTPALVDGKLTRLAGRVSMDMLAVELGPEIDARVGSTVTLWGEGLPIDDVAASAGTIGYELMCALAPRVPVRT